MPRQRGENSLPPIASAGLFALAVFTTPLLSSAEEHERLLDLEWSAPGGCPVRDDVIARVDERSGQSRSPGQRAISARGRVTASGAPARPRFRLELVIVGNETNTRTLDSDDCSHLVDAAAVILALDIEANAVNPDATATPPSPRAPPIETALPEAPAHPTRRRPEPSKHVLAPHEPTFVVHGGARLTLDEGSLPRAALGVGPVIALARGHLMLELQTITFGERFTVVGPRGGRGGAYVGLSVAAAHGCWRGIALDVEWRGCVGGEIGVESTTGVSVARPETATGLWTTASGILSVRLLPRHFISPTAGFSLAFPIAAPPVFIEGFGTVFEPRSVVLRGFIGLDVNFL